MGELPTNEETRQRCWPGVRHSTAAQVRIAASLLLLFCATAFAQDFAAFAKTPLPMPVLVLTGEKASGEFLINQGKLVAPKVEGVVIKGAGHWLMEEAPNEVIAKLVDFLNR